TRGSAWHGARGPDGRMCGGSTATPTLKHRFARVPRYTPAVPGNFGQVLIADLHGDQVHAERAELPASVYRDYIGGVGLGAYLLWRHAPAGVHPLAPEAPLIYSFSPLLGSPLTTTAKFALLCK